MYIDSLGRFHMSGSGVQYLDMGTHGDVYSRQDTNEPINREDNFLGQTNTKHKPTHRGVTDKMHVGAKRKKEGEWQV